MTGTLHDPWFWATLVLLSISGYFVGRASRAIWNAHTELNGTPVRGSQPIPHAPDLTGNGDETVNINASEVPGKITMRWSSSSTSLNMPPTVARRLASYLNHYADQLDPPLTPPEPVPEPEDKRPTSWDKILEDD